MYPKKKRAIPIKTNWYSNPIRILSIDLNTIKLKLFVISDHIWIFKECETQSQHNIVTCRTSVLMYPNPSHNHTTPNEPHTVWTRSHRRPASYDWLPPAFPNSTSFSKELGHDLVSVTEPSPPLQANARFQYLVSLIHNSVIQSIAFILVTLHVSIKPSIIITNSCLPLLLFQTTSNSKLKRNYPT